MAMHINLIDEKTCVTDYFTVGYDPVGKRYLIDITIYMDNIL